jgi:predicted transcriptional regulator
MTYEILRFDRKPTDSEAYIMKRQRLRIAREVISEGGSLVDFARIVGITRVGALKYLEKHSPATRRALADNNRGRSMHPIRVLERLRVIAGCRTQRQAAKKLGITRGRVSVFLKHYAPEGIEDALELYESLYGVPLLDAANQQDAAA